MAGQSNQVGDDEILLRRVPLAYYDHQESRPTRQAFAPRRDDDNGLSFYRNINPADLAVAQTTGKPGNVAAVRAKDLRALGLSVVADEKDPTHVLVPEVNAANRKSDGTIEITQRLADEIAEMVHVQ